LFGVSAIQRLFQYMPPRPSIHGLCDEIESLPCLIKCSSIQHYKSWQWRSKEWGRLKKKGSKIGRSKQQEDQQSGELKLQKQSSKKTHTKKKW